MAQIATITVETADGPVDLPVYEPGDSGSNRLEAFRVQTASGPGFVPLAAVDEADRPYLRVQTSSGVRAVDTSASGIPDSEDLQARYDATEISASNGDNVSTWSDETGNGHDLTAGTAPTYRASEINGLPALEFDDDNKEYLDVSFSDVSTPFQIFAAARLRETTADLFFLYDGQSQDVARFGTGGGSSTNPPWSIEAGSGQITGSASDTNAHVFNVLWDGGDSKFRLDGASDITGNPGTSALDGFTVGTRGANDFFGPYDVGEILIYPIDKTSVESDVESYLADKWGITL